MRTVSEALTHQSAERKAEEARVLFYYPLEAEFDAVTIRVVDYSAWRHIKPATDTRAAQTGLTPTFT